jgi:DNA invertase Pin-like site-specific DNA recombinase
MSTDHQQFSIDNQADAIKRYAEDQGFEIIRTYIDEAKSGLALKHRLGLAKLLSDVVGGPQPFKAILVYDVSRWGRFQDADESAYYEFLCKSAGLLNLQRVHRKFFGKAHRSPVERVTQQPD